jgi:hypothetical protein
LIQNATRVPDMQMKVLHHRINVVLVLAVPLARYSLQLIRTRAVGFQKPHYGDGITEYFGAIGEVSSVVKRHRNLGVACGTVANERTEDRPAMRLAGPHAKTDLQGRDDRATRIQTDRQATSEDTSHNEHIHAEC